MNERNKLCVQWMKKRKEAVRMMKLNRIVRCGSTYTWDGMGWGSGWKGRVKQIVPYVGILV